MTSLDGTAKAVDGGLVAWRRLSEADQSTFDTEVACSSTSQCGAGEHCMYFDANPQDGLVSFDSVLMSLVVLLQAVTFDDWATSMYLLERAFSPYVWIFFVLVCTIGGFFVVNLFLAVIFEEFLTVKRVESAEAELLARRKRYEVKRGAGTRARWVDAHDTKEGRKVVLKFVEDQASADHEHRMLSSLNEGVRSPPRPPPAPASPH